MTSQPAGCPHPDPGSEHAAGQSQRKATKPGDSTGRGVVRHGIMTRLGAYQTAKEVLLARQETIQAGFTAEYIPRGMFRNHPILISDGPQHDAQRRKVARFFAPKVVEARYRDLMESAVDNIVDRARRTGQLALDDVALHYTVHVTASIVGLTHTKVPVLARRLEKFFRQPPLDRSQPKLGRTRRQWMTAAYRGLGPVVGLLVFDVLPAIRARRKHPREDVISHLIQQDYNLADILVECVTYGTAGMVTTREFITMACWHLLDQPQLRQRYVDADQPERLNILAELIRLEPPVGHLYRRVTQPIGVSDGDEHHQLAAGDFVDLDIRATNADPAAFGPDPLTVCPARQRAAGVQDTGLSFGFGAHACPGQPLALRETDALLHRLLALPVTYASPPQISWDDLIEGYKIRNMTLQVG